jgi:hypothetical protein
MNMTDHERRILIRGMSIASGLLINAQCTHRGVITAYQKTLAEAWGIDDGDAIYREEFKQLVEELNEAIAATDPDAINPGGASKPPKGN